MPRMLLNLYKKGAIVNKAERDLNAKKRKYYDDPEKKERLLEKDIMIKIIKQYKQEKHQENRKLILHIRKRNIMKIVRCSWSIKSLYIKKIQKLKLNIQTRRYQENPEINKEYRKKNYKKYQKNKRNCDKVMYFLQKVKQGPYYICTVCHQSLYQRGVRLFKQEKYHILTEELCHPVKSFDTKLYICEACHKHEIPCQEVCNKMALSPIPDILKDLKKLEKFLILRRILFKKITIMHENGEFSKIKGMANNYRNYRSGKCMQYPTKTFSLQWINSG